MQPVSAMHCSICCKMGKQERNLEKKQKPYFPMFVDLSEKQILCIGGGTIAARRIRTLTRFTDHLIVMAPEICEEMRELLEQFPIMWIREQLNVEDILGVKGVVPEAKDAERCKKVTLGDAKNISMEKYEGEIVDATEQIFQDIYMVLAATNDHELNHAIVKACKKQGLLVNTCDDKSQCDFYFPAVTEVDGVIIGLNSGGEDPKKVSRVRKKIETMNESDKHGDSDKLQEKIR